jgi:hypothetical protein
MPNIKQFLIARLKEFWRQMLAEVDLAYFVVYWPKDDVFIFFSWRKIDFYAEA